MQVHYTADVFCPANTYPGGNGIAGDVALLLVFIYLKNRAVGPLTREVCFIAAYAPSLMNTYLNGDSID